MDQGAQIEGMGSVDQFAWGNSVIVKGEGSANVVLAYHKSTEKHSQVIRIRKPVKYEHSSPAQSLDHETWQDLFQGLDDTKPLHIDVKYITDIITPILGPQCVPSQVRILIFLHVWL